MSQLAWYVIWLIRSFVLTLLVTEYWKQWRLGNKDSAIGWLWKDGSIGILFFFSIERTC
jgi:hypothetical protein